MNPYIPNRYRIEKIFNETHDTKTFRVNTKINPLPGQFVELSILGIGEFPVSISSCSKDYIDLCIRNVGNVTNAVHSKKEGDHLWIRGPYGHGYPLKEIEGKDIILVGGGTGTAPLRGAIKFIESSRKRYGKVHIFFGFRHYNDILFLRDQKDWKKDFNFEFTLDCAPKQMKCNVGVVTALIDKAELGPDAAALVCGPPVMIKFVMDSLMKKGIKEENVYISFERLMSCGIGKCGHCEIGGRYICKHGPVFSYKDAKKMVD